MSKSRSKPESKKEESNEDYYFENGLMVFTEAYHKKRGYCCNSGCRNCPFGFVKPVIDNR